MANHGGISCVARVQVGPSQRDAAKIERDIAAFARAPGLTLVKAA